MRGDMEFQHAKQQKINLEKTDKNRRFIQFEIDFDFVGEIQGYLGPRLLQLAARMVLNGLVSPCQICCSLLCPP